MLCPCSNVSSVCIFCDQLWIYVCYSCQEREKSGGTLRSIANFFKNLGSNNSAKNTSSSSHERDDLNGRSSVGSHAQGQTRIQASQNSSYGGDARSDHLPPIQKSEIQRKSLSPRLQANSPHLLMSNSCENLSNSLSAENKLPFNKLIKMDLNELR